MLPAALVAEITAAARVALPNESCGLLIARSGDGPTRYLAVENVAASPYRYRMDDALLAGLIPALARDGESIWAIVHSHVASAAVPSRADIEQALYPDSLYLICSLASDSPDLRAWSIRAGRAVEAALVDDDLALQSTDRQNRPIRCPRT